MDPEVVQTLLAGYHMAGLSLEPRFGGHSKRKFITASPANRLKTIPDYRDETYIACRIYGTEFEVHACTMTAANPQSHCFESTAEEKWPHVMFDYILAG